MTPAATCSICGKIIPADSLDGNCPACLMQLAVADDTAKTAVTPTPESSDASSATLHASAPPPSTFAQSPFVPRSLGDYELLEEIARGGMGIVQIHEPDFTTSRSHEMRLRPIPPLPTPSMH